MELMTDVADIAAEFQVVETAWSLDQDLSSNYGKIIVLSSKAKDIFG